MGKIVFLFSGQGAQFAGMGKGWYESSSTVKALFDKAETIKPGILNIMFDGSDEELKITSNTQPALYLADLAAAIAADEAGIKADYCAGFSLGEIPALAFSGAYSFEDGFRLAVKRGEFMGKASVGIDAGMAAVVKLPDSVVEELCSHYSAVFPVNYNSVGQLTISGERSQLESFYEEVKAAGGRAIPLKVGGAFHSPFMEPASKEFGEELKKHTFSDFKIPAYSNRTAELYGGSDDVAPLLTEQINHPVRWKEIIAKAAENGADTFIETGVGSVLTKLMPKIVPEAKAFTCTAPDELQKILEELK